jgi:NMD protein affecting ribosome stability and mRNA decay
MQQIGFCHFCGDELPEGKKYYCDRDCFVLALVERKRKTRKKGNLCQQCGERFKGRNPNQRYCSFQCYNKWRVSVGLEPKSRKVLSWIASAYNP